MTCQAAPTDTCPSCREQVPTSKSGTFLRHHHVDGRCCPGSGEVGDGMRAALRRALDGAGVEP